jgi:hypothetical protein
MRTTLTIEDDVLARARALAEKLHRPFRRVVNESLRAGLEAVEAPARARPYRTNPRKMGLKTGRGLDNIQELIAQVEGGPIGDPGGREHPLVRGGSLKRKRMNMKKIPVGST